MPDRQRPYGAFNFGVVFSGGAHQISGGFSEVQGLDSEITYAEYREGDDPFNTVMKVANVFKPADVTLSRGIIDSLDIFTWFADVARGTVSLMTVTVTLRDEAGSDVVKIVLYDAQPKKWTGPKLSGKGGADVAIEQIVLTHERLEFSRAGS